MSDLVFWTASSMRCTGQTPSGELCSYRDCLMQNGHPKSLMKRHGRLYVSLDTQNLFDLALDSDQAEKGCSILYGIDQEVNVTVFRVVAM